jgi:molybdate transport repressor ModE-like protein
LEKRTFGGFSMEVGALIVAAGMSSRMGEFKPMLNIGTISIAQRIVATFNRSGVNKVVMVTGYNAVTLERHLAGNGIIFLRNENYETTQMFDSVKIGLRYLQNKCDKVLFTPVDIPLFTPNTVQAMLATDAALACPVCRGEKGHPLLIDNRLISKILCDSGEQGLRGATERCGVPLLCVPVEDPGTLYDADTPEDFAALVDYHNNQLVRPVVSVSLAKEKVFFDSKTAMLLALIDETKSVRAAGQRMQLSYSSCWNMIHRLEEQLCYPLIERTQGGAVGGVSVLTDRGREFLAKYTEYDKKVRDIAEDLFDAYFGGMF